MARVKRVDGWMVAILLLAAALRIVGLTFGQPHDAQDFSLYPMIHDQTPLHPDEYFYVAIPFEMLAQERLNPRFFENPSFLLNLNYVTFWLTCDGTQAACPYQTVDLSQGYLRNYAPFPLYIIGRLYSALGGMITVAAIYALGRLWAAHSGLNALFVGRLAAALAAVSLPLVQHAHYATTSSLATGFTALCIWACSSAFVSNPRRAWLLMLGGVAAGLAAGNRYNAAAVSIVVFVVGLIWLYRYRAWRVVLASWALFPLTFIITTPFIVLDFATVYEQFRYISGRFTSLDASPLTVTNGWFYTYRYIVLFGLGVPAALCVPVALWHAWRHRRTLTSGVLVLVVAAFVMPYSIVVLNTPLAFIGDQLTLPVLPVFIVLAAVGLAVLVQNRRIWVLLGAGVLLVMPLALTLPFVISLTQPDTRQQMQAWVYDNLPQGVRLHLVDGYNVPLDAARYDVTQTFDAPVTVEEAIAQGVDYLIVSDARQFFVSRVPDVPPTYLQARFASYDVLTPVYEVARPRWWGDTWMTNNAAYWHNPGLVIYCAAACADD